MPKNKKSTVKSFDLLSDDSYVDQVKETMMTLAAKKKRYSGVTNYDNVAKSHMEFLDNIYFQHTIGMRGLPHGTLVEIMGQDGIGKTSLLWTLAGYAMQQNSPFFLVESEAKPMDKKRVMRCLSSDKEIAERMLDRVLVSCCTNLLDAVSEIEDWVDTQRKDIGVPLDIPLVCAIDTFSKMMAPKEAEGRAYYEDVKGKKKAKTLEELGTGTNFEHAKYAQKWCRTLPAWLDNKNVILLIVSHQNQKIDMGFGGGFVSDAYNRTKIGGNAFNQNAALQLILTREGYLIHNGDKIGTKVKATVAKNSYGPEGGMMRYELVSRPWLDDGDNYQQKALYFDNTTAEWFASNGILDTRVERKRYTCESLEVTGVTADVFCNALRENPDIVNTLCAERHILGYSQADVSSSYTVVDQDVNDADDTEENE
jgi:RecA/RadA recombinase